LQGVKYIEASQFRCPTERRKNLAHSKLERDYIIPISGISLAHVTNKSMREHIKGNWPQLVSKVARVFLVGSRYLVIVALALVQAPLTDSSSSP
jgi:hypothetical protein